MAKIAQWFKTQQGYVEYGPWGFDQHRLKDKIRPGRTENSCTTWLGSMSPSGALMGAWKKDSLTGEYRQQMTQARRLLWSMINQQDVTPYRVTLTCGNQQCCNERHFEIKETNRPDKEQ
jgi:hypothetical protein